MAKKQNGIVWVRDSLTPGILEMPSKIRQSIASEFRDQTPKVQSYMKSNASWNDRTGAARNGLQAEYMGDRNVERQAIRVFHGVGYGIFLETRFAGKYAIILPTLQYEGDRIMSDLSGFLGRMTGGGVSFTSGISSPGLLV